MKEVKYRVWNKKTKKMISPEKLQEMSVFAIKDDLPLEKFMVLPIDDDYVLLEFTGLRDKNGVEIYESDILNLLGWNEYEPKVPDNEIRYVDFKEGCFTVIEFGANPGWCNINMVEPGLCEVIGNTYEDKEIVGEKAE